MLAVIQSGLFTGALNIVIRKDVRYRSKIWFFRIVFCPGKPKLFADNMSLLWESCISFFKGITNGTNSVVRNYFGDLAPMGFSTWVIRHFGDSALFVYLWKHFNTFCTNLVVTLIHFIIFFVLQFYKCQILQDNDLANLHFYKKNVIFILNLHLGGISQFR